MPIHVGYGGEFASVRQSDFSWTQFISTIGQTASQIIGAVTGRPTQQTTTTQPGGTVVTTRTGTPDYSTLIFFGIVVLGAVLLFRK